MFIILTSSNKSESDSHFLVNVECEYCYSTRWTFLQRRMYPKCMHLNASHKKQGKIIGSICHGENYCSNLFHPVIWELSQMQLFPWVIGLNIRRESSKQLFPTKIKLLWNNFWTLPCEKLKLDKNKRRWWSVFLKNE